jgi:hypothetical protein
MIKYFINYLLVCLSRNNIIFNFTYPLRCLRVPPGVRLPQVEYHWHRGQKEIRGDTYTQTARCLATRRSDTDSKAIS